MWRVFSNDIHASYRALSSCYLSAGMQMLYISHGLMDCILCDDTRRTVRYRLWLADLRGLTFFQ
jgi:hypothetical protein